MDDRGALVARSRDRRVAGAPELLTVVVNTYARPAALDLVLRAFSDQTDDGFELIVAEDGADAESAAVVEAWRSAYAGRLEHVMHADEGYRRARIVDLAALAARGNYFVFLDGDCLPRRRFVAAVRQASVPGWFLSTKRIKLGPAFTQRVLSGDVPVWRWSAATWMIRGGAELKRPGFLVPLRDRRRPWRPELPDFEPAGNAYGFLCAMSRADLERVNGWDARFVGWGSDDIDLVVRLRRAGLRCGWAGPDSTLVHLWHPYGRNPDDPRFLANEELVRETVASGRVEAIEGLRELATQVTANRAAESSSSSEPVNT